MSDETSKDIVIKALIAGHVCAFVSAFVNPLDVTKIRLQNQNTAGTAAHYKGMISGALVILREEGLRGWCKGLTASMLREISYSSVRIGAYEPIRAVLSRYLSYDFSISILLNTDNKIHVNEMANRGADGSQVKIDNRSRTTSPLVKFSAALMSGGVGAAMANPLDLIKTRFQATLPGQPLPYRSTLRAFVDIYAKEGLSGLYRGWMVTSFRAAILTSAQLGSYDTIKNNILINVFQMNEGFPLHLCASMASGLITTTAANPVDVIKTRFMADQSGKYKNPIDCIAVTYKEGGIRAFFKVNITYDVIRLFKIFARTSRSLTV
jgi:Mitochondrial carrier protein